LWLYDNVYSFIALAPVAWVSHQESLLLTFLADLDLAEWLYLFGEMDFLPENWVLQLLAKTLCKEVSFLCEDVVFLLCGTDVANLNATR
jgi:hypothetical protein